MKKNIKFIIIAIIINMVLISTHKLICREIARSDNSTVLSIGATYLRLSPYYIFLKDEYLQLRDKVVTMKCARGKMPGVSTADEMWLWSNVSLCEGAPEYDDPPLTTASTRFVTVSMIGGFIINVSDERVISLS